MARPKRYKRIITGGGVSATGFSVDTTLVPTGAQHCQVLIDVIDDKDVFVMSPHLENGAYSLKSLEEVRRIATSTLSLVDSEEVMEEVKNIQSACRTFMRSYEDGDDPRVLDASLAAVRADVGESVAFLVKILRLNPPVHFDVSPYEPRATEILSGWLDR